MHAADCRSIRQHPVQSEHGALGTLRASTTVEKPSTSMMQGLSTEMVYDGSNSGSMPCVTMGYYALAPQHATNYLH
jgi:cytochrome c oxidase assembly protein Cox11